MASYYRFQNDRPRAGEEVHCFKSLQGFKDFCNMMKTQDPNFLQMKFWQIEGVFKEEDDGDAVVRVVSAKEIRL